MSGRVALREIEVMCPRWSTKPVRMREPTVKIWRDSQKAGDDQDRTIAMLGQIVLGDDGEPVGVAAINAAPLGALGQLSVHVNTLIGEATEDPLAPKTDSTTVSPSP